MTGAVVRDRTIEPHQAARWHWRKARAGRLVLWTVYDHPRDYPDAYVARPWVIAEAGLALPFCLIADELGALRDMLPPGLACLARQAGDDAVIVETWL